MAKDHDPDLEEAKRVMARLVSMPPKPHKEESAERKADKAGIQGRRAGKATSKRPERKPKLPGR
jgi:hypothetical protein